jgi:hypothetical protein
MGLKGSTGRASMLLAAVLALALVVAPGAAAKGKKKHKTRPFAVVTATASATSSTSGSEMSATATCPSGMTAVGGGFDTPGSPQSLFIATESIRVGANTWRVRGVAILPSPGSQELIAEAYCAKLGGTVLEAPAETAIGAASGESATVSSTCSSGSRLLSGGFSGPLVTTPGVSFAIPRTSKPAGNGWSVRSTRVADGPPAPAAPIRVVSYCFKAPKKKGKKKRKKKTPAPKSLAVLTGPGTLPSTPLSRASALSPACPAKTSVISGGFEVPDASANGLPIMDAAHLSGGIWRVDAVQFGSPTVPAPFTAYEDCA